MVLYLGKAGNVMESAMHIRLGVVSRNEGEKVPLLPLLHVSHFFPFYDWVTKAFAKRAQGAQTGQPPEDMPDGQSLPLSVLFPLPKEYFLSICWKIKVIRPSEWLT